MDCTCRSRYEAVIDKGLVPLLSNRQALFARIAEGPDVQLPSFSPACLAPCHEAADLLRVIAASRVS